MPKKVLAVLGLMLAVLAGVAACASIRLPAVALAPSGAAAAPAVLAAFGDDPAVTTADDWTARRAGLLREAFQTQIYGRWPGEAALQVSSKRALSTTAFPSAAAIEEWRVDLGPAGGFSMVVFLRRGSAPAPMIVVQNFCGNAAAFAMIQGVTAPPATPPECQMPLLRPVIRAIVGDAIITPPVQDILQAGYGLAVFYAAEVAPDDAETAGPALGRLTPAGTPENQRIGAIAAWAWTYVKALEALAADPRVDAERIALWGHSRNGKAALLAAAMDPRPAAVIALQAGTAGGSLGRDDVGESISAIVKTYPHWFAPAYAAYANAHAALPIDQHQLIALIAPRPVLLAGARRDAWSDPHGAFHAAQGAAPVYTLFGAPPFRQTDLRAPDFAHPLVTYMRPGLHGVHTSDWELALAFLDARLNNPATAPVRAR